ncbi:MAG: MarR family winged helix-turn-helix transcriptional regulator, partial [Caulobacter sp.]
VVASLVKRGLIEQAADQVDRRQKLLRLTSQGQALWNALPDLIFIQQAAFGGLDEADIEAAVRVLKAATERLNSISVKGRGE